MKFMNSCAESDVLRIRGWNSQKSEPDFALRYIWRSNEAVPETIRKFKESKDI